MCRDYIDSLRYMADEFKRHYLGEWNIKEENNMSIYQKLRADLTRIFRGRNPLDFIEDARIVEYPDSTKCEVTLRVPSVAELSMRQFYTDELMDSCIRSVLDPKPPKSPEESKGKKAPVWEDSWLKPERIIYSGPKTIVFWPDGTKTMVSLGEGQEHDDYTAYCAAVVKKMFGATHKAKKFIQSIAVRQKSNPRKPKEEPEEMLTVEVQTVGSEEVREVPVTPWVREPIAEEVNENDT